MKSKNITLVLFLVIAFLASSAVAEAGTYQYTTRWFYNGNPINGIRGINYECGDANCNVLGTKTFDQTSATNSIMVPYNIPAPFYGYATYWGAQCYIYQEMTWKPTAGGSSTQDITLTKKSSCSSPIRNVIVPPTIQVGTSAQITVNVSSAMTEAAVAPFGEPNDATFVRDFLSSQTSVTLNVRDSLNNIVYTQTLTDYVLRDTAKTYVFGWIPTTPGTYTFEVISNVPDCKCTSSQQLTTNVPNVVVTTANTAPLISPNIPDINLSENSGINDNVVDLWQYITDAQTPDNLLTYAIVSETNTAVVDCMVDTNQYIDCTVLPDMVGYSDVRVRVTDPQGLFAEDVFRVFVSPVNQLPVVNLVSPALTQQFTLCENITLNVNATDADGSIQSIVWTIDGVTYTGNNIAVPATSFGVGQHTGSVVVTDNVGGTTTLNIDFSILLHTNPIVTIMQPIADPNPTQIYPFQLGTMLTFDALAAATDSCTPSAGFQYIWRDTSNEIISQLQTFSIDSLALGLHNITVYATDGIGGAAADSMVVNIITNQPPVVSNIPDVNMLEDTVDTSLVLNNYVTDPDNPLSDITWSVSGNVNINIVIDPATSAVTITPAADWYGTEAVTFTACDLGPLCDSDVVMINVAPVNDAPVISDVPDITMAEDTTRSIALDNYVSDIDNLDSELVWSVSGNVNINIIIDPLSRIATFTPALNWNGVEIVTFTVCDPAGLCDTDTATITVTPVNDCPTVSDIPNVIMDEDTVDTSLDLDNYAVDIDGDALSWTASGNVNVFVSIDPATNVVTLMPAVDWNGAESIIFTASDSLCSDSDNLVVTVNPINDAPVISDIPDVTMNEDTIDSSLDLDDYVNDIDNLDSELAWSVIGNVNIAIIIDPVSHIAILMPILNWNGQETVTFTVCDPAGLCDSDTSTITVNPVNDCPVVSAIPDVVMDEDTTDMSIDLDSYGSDVDGNVLSWTASGNVNIAVSIDPATHVVTLTPAANWNGVEAITFTASDSICQASDSAIVTVRPVNDPPVITDIPDMTMQEDTTRSIYLDDYASDIDNADSQLTWSFSGNVNINVLLDPISHIATFTPALNWNGAETITFTVCDPAGLCDSDPLTITVTPVNDAPVVGNIPDVFMYEDVPYTTMWSLDDFVNDVDNLDSEITWTVAGNININAAIDPATRTVTFTSPLDWNGVETLTFTGCDPSGLCDSDVSAVIVQPVNDAPVITDVPDVTMNEDTFAVLDLDNYASDVDNTNAELSWTVAGNVNINIMIDPATNVAVITPAADWYGSETVTYTVCDPAGLCDSDTSTITVNPVNDCPVVSAIPDVVMDEDTFAVLDLDDYVSDVDNTDAQISWTASGNVNIAVAIDPATHVVTFTPAADWNGAEAITFSANDGACSVSDDMIVTVLPVNDPPVITDVPDVNMPEDSTYLLMLDNYVSDIDNTDAQMTWTVSGNVNINIVIDAATRIAIISPAANWNGAETVTFTVCDLGGLCDSDTSTITVTPVNDAPLVGDVPDVTFDEDTIYTTSWSLDGYVTDIDNTDAEITWTYSGNANIAVSINPARTVTFTPAADWNGAEVITFTGCDPSGLCSSNNSVVVVRPVNDAPVALDIPDITIIEDGAVSIDLDDYATDIDNTLAELTWTASGGTYIRVFIDAVSHVAIIVPNTDWNGAETITFTVCDPAGLCDSDDSLITVVPQGDAPIISFIPNVMMYEDTPYTTTWSLDDYVSDIDNTDAEMTWTVSGNTNINVVVDPATRRLTFTSTLNWNGAETITFTACDPTVPIPLCDSATTTVMVIPVNDAPVIGNIPDVTIMENSFDNSIDLDNYITDIDGDPISWTYSGNTNIIVIIDANNVVTLVPLPNWNGVETITFTASDGTVSVSDLSVVTVVPVNSAPVVSDIPDVFMNEDTTYVIALDNYVTDIDDPDSQITWSAVSSNANLTVAIDPVSHNATLIPLANWAGISTINFTACDPSGACDSDLSQVWVLPVNDAPWINPAIPPQNGIEDTPWTLDLSIYENDIEDGGMPEPDALRWSVSGVNTSLFTVSFDAAQNIITFTPVANANGVDTITFTLVDSGGLTDTQDVAVTITPVNDAPVLLADIINITVDEDTVTTFLDLDLYAFDADNEVLTWTVTGSVNTGVTINPDNSVTIAPALNWNGQELVTFTGCDAAGACISDTSMITVRPVNDAPVVGDIPNVFIPEDGFDTSIDLDNYVTDVDIGDIITWSYSGNINIAVSIDPATKIVTLTPPADWNGAETITFTACDLGPLCDSDMSTITVNAVNDAPVISSILVTPDPVSVNGVLTCSVTASDIDGNPVTLSYVWTTTGAYSLAGFTTSTLNLNVIAGEAAGNVITCTATPNDGIVDGAPASDSATVTAAPLPACSDGLDNDGDTHIDYPNDPGCIDAADIDETDPVPLPLCADGLDNDGDMLIDYPADPGCAAASDNDETNVVVTQCSDGIDNDGDTYIDMADSGCANPLDNDETNPLFQCNDGVDNDGDLLIDLADPGCTSLTDNDETNPVVMPQCSNGVDDDGDTLTDFPNDPGCVDAADNDETNPFPLPQCADSIDNDGDTFTDYPNDPGCTSAADNDEIDPVVTPQCADGIDNDGDTLTDYPYDPGCISASDNDETNPVTPPQCADGLDNDGDGFTDYPADMGCSSAADNDESNAAIPTGNFIGIVIDFWTGKGLQGATVTAGGFSATTNADGYYLIQGVMPGTYSITASYPGYSDQTWTGQVIVAGKRTVVNFAVG